MAIGRNLKPLVRNGKAFSPVTNLTVHLKKIAIINQLQIALFRQLNHKACQVVPYKITFKILLFHRLKLTEFLDKIHGV